MQTNICATITAGAGHRRSSLHQFFRWDPFTDRVSRHDGGRAPDIVIARGGPVAEDQRLPVGGNAATGIDIDAAA